jgi:flagellar motor switch protein FliN/FliY
MSTQDVVLPVPTQEALQYLDHEIKRCLTSSLMSMLGGASVSAERERNASYPPSAIWFSGKFTGEAGGSIHFALDPEGAVAMGHKLLVAAGLEGESDETAVETLGEVFSQTTGGLASTFLARLKKEVVAQPLAKVAAPAHADHAMSYRLTTSDGGVLQLQAVLDASLVTALTLQPPEPLAKTTAPVPVALPPPAAPSTRNLELLLDVELPVSVSFGRAQLQLKDVIKLTTGSIVELNRSVSEPVDIVVNNCVIARGEVVVIEGNFGVRIKQIVSKEDRLRSLG